ISPARMKNISVPPSPSRISTWPRWSRCRLRWTKRSARSASGTSWKRDTCRRKARSAGLATTDPRVGAAGSGRPALHEAGLEGAHPLGVRRPPRARRRLQDGRTLLDREVVLGQDRPGIAHEGGQEFLVDHEASDQVLYPLLGHAAPSGESARRLHIWRLGGILPTLGNPRGCNEEA